MLYHTTGELSNVSVPIANPKAKPKLKLGLPSPQIGLKELYRIVAYVELGCDNIIVPANYGDS